MTSDKDFRPSWNDYFINIACEVAQRATCPRAQVGAVIVKDRRILSTGYNGAPTGEPHCFDSGCIVTDAHCLRAIHAEVNAVCQAAKYGISVEGAVLYYWDSQERDMCCHNCIQVMKAAGIVGYIDRSGNYTSLKNSN